jgi:dihydroxy-acid dehydratase
MIGICNTASDLNPCNAHLTSLADHVKRGVWEAGGVPFEFPTISLGEPLMRPTAMAYRNLMSMDVEESIRANPLDAVVLLGGCDKTVPALLMGAASVDLPTILLTGGPMLNGKFQGRDIGSGTDVWKFSEAVRAGTMSEQDFLATEACIARSPGHCMTMGTASTMACLAEAMGIAPAGSAAIPAVDARRLTLAQLTGRRIVEMAGTGLTVSAILQRPAFENAIRVNAALAGSTNAVIHLLAIAGRLGVPLTLDDFDGLGREIPVLANLRPSGEYLMEDFFYAGGLPGLLGRIAHLLDLDAPTVEGGTLRDQIDPTPPVYDDDVIRPFDRPIVDGPALAVLTGNLCPDGAVIKVSAASPRLTTHRGRAIVFDSIEECLERIDDPGLEVDASSVLVLRNSGPRGYPGMPEIGGLPLPRRLLAEGVDDMVRISDARMSGTAYGTVVLHVTPESAAGGPLGLVETGDWITLDVGARLLNLEVDDAELERRAGRLRPLPELHDRGYLKLYRDHVLGAETGADFDFLRGGSGSGVPRRSF